ncbi:uncharacterized protein LOC100272308 [Zea mays]|uniref:Uncharacterized protein n=1 Tax=Zea mays TaxID=4577 RepID=B4FMW7_MAIZE|nr:uncharacterized protein LOC100272308 [Zea mays]ACF83460.1 unknown [Zea mays]|eukprot:NP_001140265.1 uncharacterized protein LOC100272308 [Zea mays]
MPRLLLWCFPCARRSSSAASDSLAFPELALNLLAGSSASCRAVALLCASDSPLLGSAVASCSLVAEHSPCARAFSVQFLEHLGLSMVAPFVVGARLLVSVCRVAPLLFLSRARSRCHHFAVFAGSHLVVLVSSPRAAFCLPARPLSSLGLNSYRVIDLTAT